MKKSFKVISLMILIVAVFSVGVFAGSNMQAITAYLNYGITVEYNDVDQVMSDANGTRVYPITYNGTTYLPVRAVANMLGVKVDWDGGTNHVLLGNSYVDTVSQPSVSTTPTITNNQFDFSFIGNIINSYGKGNLVLSDDSIQYIDSNGIWLGKYWDGGSSCGAYTFPTISFVNSKGRGYSVDEMSAVYNALKTELLNRGYRLVKTDDFGQDHFVNGIVEIKLWNINNSNTNLSIDVETNWQACCVD